MTALVRTRGAVSEMARLFDASPVPGLDWSVSIWPGEKVPVVIEADGGRHLITMTWGLPHDAFNRPLPRPQRSMLFARDQIADGSRLRNPSNLHRCLIVLESFAHPAGDAGTCTRDWFGLWDEPLTAWAGFCTPDRRHCAGITMLAVPLVADRSEMMPRLLRREDWSAWLGGTGLLSLGPPHDEADFYRENLGELWSTGRPDSEPLPLFAA